MRSSGNSSVSRLSSPKASVKGKWKCSECKQQFRERNRLMEHINDVHSTDDPRFLCSICRVTLDDQRSFDIHKKQHEIDKKKFKVKKSKVKIWEKFVFHIWEKSFVSTLRDAKDHYMGVFLNVLWQANVHCVWNKFFINHFKWLFVYVTVGLLRKKNFKVRNHTFTSLNCYSKERHFE